MRYGFVIPNNLGIADVDALVELGRRAEALGFDSIWVNHHILHVGYVKERLGTAPYQDALILLSWLASKTQTIGLGTSVLVMPYLHPMALAKHLATLDQLCNGRLMIGLGAGSLPEENAALGVPYAARGRYCNEFLQVLRLLWTEDAASFQGEFFAFDELCASPKPLQQPHPPILIGGNRPAALKRAARFGDGWHPLNVSPEGVQRRMATLREAADAAGRGDAAVQAVQVRLDMSRVDAATAAAYAAEGVTDLVMHVASSDVDKQRGGDGRLCRANAGEAPVMNVITIWGGGTTRTLRPIWVAEELGLSFEHHPIGPRTGETKTDLYTRLNPKQKIPFLEDGEIKLSESIAMSRYLIERYGSPETMTIPDTLALRAREDEWVCYVYGELDETSLYVMRRHRDLDAVYGSAPAAVESSRAYAEKHLGVVAAHLESRKFLLGERFGLADVVLGTCLDWAVAYGFTLPAVLREYRTRLKGRPAYERAVATNYAGGGPSAPTITSD